MRWSGGPQKPTQQVSSDVCGLNFAIQPYQPIAATSCPGWRALPHKSSVMIPELPVLQGWGSRGPCRKGWWPCAASSDPRRMQFFQTLLKMTFTPQVTACLFITSFMLSSLSPLIPKFCSLHTQPQLVFPILWEYTLVFLGALPFTRSDWVPAGFFLSIPSVALRGRWSPSPIKFPYESSEMEVRWREGQIRRKAFISHSPWRSPAGQGFVGLFRLALSSAHLTPAGTP